MGMPEWIKDFRYIIFPAILIGMLIVTFAYQAFCIKSLKSKLSGINHRIDDVEQNFYIDDDDLSCDDLSCIVFSKRKTSLAEINYKTKEKFYRLEEYLGIEEKIIPGTKAKIIYIRKDNIRKPRDISK